MTTDPALPVSRLDLRDYANVWLISDLHLSPDRPALSELLTGFIDDRISRSDADAVVLLGDIFEYWIGDDAEAELGHTQHAQSLRRLTDAGIALWFMHGNRDFMVGRSFIESIGAGLMAEQCLVQFASITTLLCHGDELCTDDTAHQEFRSLVRSQPWQDEFLAKSIDARIDVAQQARSASTASKATKPMDIMDVNAAAVVNALTHHGVDLMIHGHTHRPAIHQLATEKGSAPGSRQMTRVVLGDWRTSASSLHVKPGVMQLVPGSQRPGPFNLIV